MIGVDPVGARRIFAGRREMLRRIYAERVGGDFARRLAEIQLLSPEFRYQNAWAPDSDGGKGIVRWLTDARYETGYSVEAIVNALRYHATRRGWHQRYPGLLQALERDLRSYAEMAKGLGVWRDAETWTRWIEAIIGWELEVIQTSPSVFAD